MKTTILSICVFLMVFCSCSDWLNVEPKTTIKEEEVFSRELGFKEALTGIYIKMAQTNLYGRTLTYGFMDRLGRYYNPGSDDELLFEFPSTQTESYCESIWGDMYNIIANLNNLIYYCDKNRDVLTTENYYEIIKGEALGLRAFLHFDLLRIYGPVYKESPESRRVAYRTEFNNQAKAMQPSNVVMDSVIHDLTRAEELLTGTDPLNFEFPTTSLEEEGQLVGDQFLTYRHKRMNLYAVKALLARAYLYIGDKENAARYAEEVVNSDYFELISNNNDLLRSKEILFSIYIDDFEDQITVDMNRTTYLVEEEYLNEIYDTDNDGVNDFRFREGISFERTSTGMKMMKYNQDTKWPSTEGTIVLVRLSEMYYILAECAATVDDAANYLNAVRDSRGVDPIICTEQTRMDEIEEEYRKEFYGEGQLFFYYKRQGATTFLHCPRTSMAEENYVFSWPENEELFGQTLE